LKRIQFETLEQYYYKKTRKDFNTQKVLGEEADEIFEQSEDTQEEEQLVLIDTHSNQATVRDLGKFIK